nr:HAD hydrolase-like protein [Lachnospiraceae bacterium]
YKGECNCRKPKLGMYEQAVKEYDIDLGKSFAIGDKIRDCAICQVTDCQGFLIGNNEKDEIIGDVKAGKVRGVGYAKDLRDAAGKILGFNKI